jgi:exonuclease SbcD
MRILHTADWHLGNRLSGHDRTDELFAQVEHVCQLAEQHSAEVLLVAGDIFEPSRRSALPELTKRLADLLAPVVRRGMHLILLPGNHDDREHFRMMYALLALEQKQNERVHIVRKQEIFTIADVQFAVIPYPTPELLEPYRLDATGATQRHTALSNVYAKLVRSIESALDPALPAVFVAHVNVAGVTTPSEHELNYNDDIRLGTEDLPLKPNLAYIALGHIHQQQKILHPVPCYYSGSIDRLNLGEREDEKYVLLVDVAQHGPATVTPLPLASTPFYDLRFPIVKLETLPDQYPDISRAFARIHLECQAGDDSIMLRRRVLDLCPRCLDVQFSGIGLPSTTINSPAQPKDYVGTVMGHLRELFAADPDLPELERRANELISEVRHALAAD